MIYVMHEYDSYMYLSYIFTDIGFELGNSKVLLIFQSSITYVSELNLTNLFLLDQSA